MVKRTATAIQTLLWVLISSTVDGQVLEYDADDFQITAVGTPGDTADFAIRQEIAYNSADDEYLVVYLAYDGFGPTVDGEEELWGQRVSARGEAIGDRVLLTDVGGLGTVGPRLFNYQVAYIPSRNGYFLTYNADDPDFPAVTGFRVFGVILDAMGVPQGGAVQLTSGTNGDFRPHFAYNGVDDEVLVAWSRADGASPAAVFVRAVSATDGSPISNERRVNTDDSFSSDPAVGFDPINRRYLIYWRRGENQSPMIQLLNPAGQTQLASDRELASAGFRSSRGNVAFDPVNAEFLVIWTNSDPTVSSMSPDSYEVFGRRVAADGSVLGSDKFRVSTSSDVFNAAFGANADCSAAPCTRTARPGLAYSAFDESFIASWSATVLQTDSAQASTNQSEAFVRVLLAGGDADPAIAQQQVSDVGGLAFGPAALHATVAATGSGRFMAAWWGDDSRDGRVAGEFEIFGQLLITPAADRVFDNSFETPVPPP